MVMVMMLLLHSFITYRSCPHLDSKHTIFGRVVGGLATLSAMEAIETDNKDCPIEDIRIEEAVVFVDPFKEADKQARQADIVAEAPWGVRRSSDWGRLCCP